MLHSNGKKPGEYYTGIKQDEKSIGHNGNPNTPDDHLSKDKDGKLTGKAGINTKNK